MSTAYQIVVCAGIVLEPLQTREPVASLAFWNPNGIPSFSPRLRGTSYLGSAIHNRPLP
jgi:hypothetical protein